VAKRMWVVGVCLLAVLVASGGLASAAGRWAVICGIADYESINDLNYTDDDARDMAAALRKYPEWNQGSDQIVVLIDSAASKQGVLGAIQQMGSKAAEGDTCVFFFSGHGTQVRDFSGEEADKYDEAICPWDTSSSASSLITDDELGACLTASLANQQVVVILDTCFSGGMAAKGVTVKSVGMPGVPADAKAKRSFGFRVAQRLAQRKPPGGNPPGGGGGGLPSQDIGGSNSVVLMACQEGKLSYETSALQNGVFSNFVIEGLGIPPSPPPADSDHGGAVTAEEDFRYAAPKTTAYMRVQKPRLYGGSPYAEVELVGGASKAVSPQVALATDKASYGKGEKAKITASVTDGADGSPIEGATVQVVVVAEDGDKTEYEGTTDSAGIVTFTFKVGPAAGGSGSYEVSATASKDGAAGKGSTVFALGQTVAILNPLHWDDGNQRWRDIATNPYAPNKKSTSFYDSASVTVTYENSATTFKGTLNATGLKPNFAYQIKLNGKPTSIWGAGGDDWANQQLGNLGRWWGDEGYIFFDYFVTDAAGKASKSLALNSSLHVLWKTTQRTRTSSDTTATSYSVIARKSSGWYGQDYPKKTVKIYGEWESGRPKPGKVVLPTGNYNVRLFLTEESFHESALDSGSWATVMGNDNIVFTIAR